MSSILLAVGASIAWAAWYFPESFLGTFYEFEVESAAGILPWLMISFAIFAQGYVFSTLLTARGDMRRLNQMAGAGAVLNIALNAWWLSQASSTTGGIGCAVISAITQGVMVAGQIFFCLRHHPGKQWWKLARALILHSLACFTICSAVSRLDINPNQALWMVLFGCLASGLAPGVIDFRSIQKMLSEKMNTFADS
jgi:Na+-driven multidrug efflux pump